MDLGLTGRKALVTGASKGIGYACALELAREGMDVTLVARGEADLETAATAIAAQTGRKVHAYAADLTAPGAPDAAVAFHCARHGGLDVLVNNAGGAASGDFFELTDAQWEESFALKFHGYVRTCRAAFPHLEQSGHGVIVNNVGAAAKQPKPGFLIGGAINAALNNVTKGLAEIGGPRGVRVVSMNSGPVRVERMEKGLIEGAEAAGIDVEAYAAKRAREVFGMTRYALPEDMGAFCAFLASDRAVHVHGANLFIDGGQTKEV
ncbi:MAG TPA: SDR family NAD(P)-dependent oxidoreductase [Paracoccaceae bacterium]|nr:SDR family NAD(P)-dependent oxidoreductase [Paracoccaceae bacterium]